MVWHTFIIRLHCRLFSYFFYFIKYKIFIHDTGFRGTLKTRDRKTSAFNDSKYEKNDEAKINKKIVEYVLY